MKKATGFIVVMFCMMVLIPSIEAANVAVFDDSGYVDTAGGSGAESDTVQASLASLGHTVNPFTGIGSGDFSVALGGADVLLAPTQTSFPTLSIAVVPPFGLNVDIISPSRSCRCISAVLVLATHTSEASKLIHITTIEILTIHLPWFQLITHRPSLKDLIASQTCIFFLIFLPTKKRQRTKWQKTIASLWHYVFQTNKYSFISLPCYILTLHNDLSLDSVKVFAVFIIHRLPGKFSMSKHS